MALHEWDGAVEAGEKATAFENNWSVNHSVTVSVATRGNQSFLTRWVGYQTLGRAHLGLGQLETARTCFQKAV